MATIRAQKLVSESFTAVSNEGAATDQLADLQDQFRTLEQRMTAIRDEVITFQREIVEEGDLTRALAVFDPCLRVTVFLRTITGFPTPRRALTGGMAE